MRVSGLTRYLRGKILDSISLPVKNIVVHGNQRVVISKDGSLRVFSKEDITRQFKSILARNQKELMKKTMRKTTKGVRIHVGGLVKGKIKYYKTKSNAKGALTKYYGS
jgi:hypothetical protein